MKLLEVLPLLEARKNPEQNPRLSAYDQLLKYKDNPNVYISMTQLPKLGINPVSHFDTPNGIYCYPLQMIWRIYHLDISKSLEALPFRSNAPYIQVFEWNGKGKIVNVDRSYYTDDDLDRDIAKLKKMFPDAIDRIDYGITHAAHQDTPASGLFYAVANLTSGENKTMIKRKLGKEMVKYQEIEYKPYSPGGRQSANIYRALGYAGFVDYGNKIIHKNEPYQAVFLSKEYINHLDTVLNKHYRRYKEEQLKSSDNYIEGGMYIGTVKGHKIILAKPETEKQLSYSEAIEYCKSLGTGWRLPTVDEMSYIVENFENNWGDENKSLTNTLYWTISADMVTIHPKSKYFSLATGIKKTDKYGTIAVKNVLPNGTYSSDGYIKYPESNGGIYIGDYKNKKLILSPKSLANPADNWKESEKYINSLAGWKVPTKDEWKFIHDNANFLPPEYAISRIDNYWAADTNEKGDHWWYKFNDDEFEIFSFFYNSSNDEFCVIRPIKLV